MMGTGGAGGSRPAMCHDNGRPANAPALTAGTWKNIGPALNWAGDPSTGASAHGMAIDTCNPSTLFFCVDDFDATKGGLYKTTDGGTTWAKVGNLDEPFHVRVDPKNSLHLYVGDGVRGATLGFWVSNDGGDTWTKPAGWVALAASTKMLIDDVYDVAPDPADFNHVLVTSHSGWGQAEGSNSGVLETKDGGNTWTVHPSMSWGTGHDVWFLKNSDTWLLGTQDHGMWRTTDAGKTWTQVTTQNMSHGGGQVYISKSGPIYTTSFNGVLRSTDDGATWTKVGTVDFVTGVFGDGKTLYTHKAYTGTDAPFFTSPETDGVTWTAYNGGAQTFSNGPFELYFDQVNGILYSSNWGNGFLALKVP